MVMILKRGSNKAEIDLIMKKLSVKKEIGIDAYKFCGVIKLRDTPNTIQKKLRSEWV